MPSNKKDDLKVHGLAGTDIAPEGLVWVCGACGKRSRSMYGFDAEQKNCADHGWDESCMMHAVLCVDLNGKVEPVEKDFVVGEKT